MTAARCLHGTAQSGQLHCILKSVHFSGNILSPHSEAMSITAGSSSCLSSFETMSGLSIIPWISLSTSSGKNGGTIMVTEYGRGRLPSTFALMTFPLTLISRTAPARAYVAPRGIRFS